MYVYKPFMKIKNKSLNMRACMVYLRIYPQKYIKIERCFGVSLMCAEGDTLRVFFFLLYILNMYT